MSHLSREFVDFFRQLSPHNTREWFHANMPAYEQHVKAPFYDFVDEVTHR